MSETAKRAEDQPHDLAAASAYARGRRLRGTAAERRRISGRPGAAGSGCARAVLAGPRAGRGAGADQLAETLQLSAHLGVLDGTDVLYLVRRTPNTPLASNVRVGSRLPAHATTMGRMLLAFMPPVEIERSMPARSCSASAITPRRRSRRCGPRPRGSPRRHRLERSPFRARHRLGGGGGVRFRGNAARRHQRIRPRRRVCGRRTPRDHRQ